MKQYSQILVFTASLLTGQIAVAGDYTFSTGVEYTSGDYGGSIDTTMFQVPFTLGYNTEKYAWSVTVPYVRISGSEDVTFSSTTKSAMLTTTTKSNVTHTDSGLGDITLSGTYQLQKETKARPWIAVTGKIKLGTADENKQLGTGANDYAIQAELAKKTFHGFIGYKIVGDTSTVNYNNIMYGAVGVTVPVNKTWNSVAEYYTEQAAISGTENIQELTLSFNRVLSDKKKFSIYIIKGLTNTSHDFGAGVSLTYPLKI